MLLDATKLLSLSVLVIWAGSCSGPPQEYDIDKPSPNGLYRVKIKVTPGERGKSVDRARFQFLQGHEIVDSWDWEQQDQWEVDFSGFMPIEWVDNNVLHMGAERPRDGFSDEVTILNATGENLRYVSVSYGRYESFWIFDLAHGSKVTLHPAPWFTVKGDEFAWGYGGVGRSGKKYGNVVESGERTSPHTGPLKFEITITAKDLL